MARVVGPGLALLAVLALIGAQPELVETAYSEAAGLWVARALGAATGWVPISLAELVQGAVIGWVLLAPVPALVEVARRDRSLHNAALHGLARLIVLTVLAAVGFYLAWGLNYARPPLGERLGWQEPDPEHPLATLEVILLADDLVDLANARYLEVHGAPDAGAMTAAPDRARMQASVEAGWARAVDHLALQPALAAPRPPAKPLLASPLFSRLGLSGFYFPFTGEANYNAQTPGWQLPHTIAHEKAHQRGLASEDEANFAGLVACLWSPDPVVQYSGALFAQRQLLFVLLEADPDTAYALILRRLPGVQRDVTEARAFWEARDGRARDLSRVVNDAYLRANRVPGGIDSYNRSTALLLSWARARGLTVPTGPPS